MPPDADNRRIDRQTDQSKAGVAAQAAPVNPAGASAAQAAVSAAPGTPSALVVQSRPGEPEAEEDGRDGRLDRLAMQLDVMVRIQSFRVQDLLALEKGSVLETVHEHTQDVPLRSGGALLAWAEFEVLDQQLAVRVTRLA